MLPKSVQTRHRACYDFESCYEQLCCLQASIPLKCVKAHLKEGVMDINGDKIRMIDWAPVLDTIKINKSLRYIAIRSFYQLSSSTTKKSHYFKRKVPAICMKDVTQWIARSLMTCVAVSSALKCLDFQGVPLRECDLALFAKGMEKNISLSYVSFNYCQIADRGVEIFCQAAKNHPCLTHLSFSGCNLTKNGTVAIAKFIKHQSTLRHNEAWAESLRYRIPNFNCMGGIRRITLNSNPMIGDDGIGVFSDVLKDDLWLKALDFQHCGISTNGVLMMLETMRYNNTLVVLDVRQNPMIDRSALRALLGRVLMNAKDCDEVDYPWIKEEPPKDPYCVKKPRPSRKRSLNSVDISSTKPRLKTTPKYKSSMAWRHVGSKSPPLRRSYCGCKSEDDFVLLHVTPEKCCNSDGGTFSGEVSDALNESILLDERKLPLCESHVYIKQLKIDVINTHRKLQAALESEKQLHSKVMTLEVENARLRKELADSFQQPRAKSQLEDDKLLDSIEQSFNKFHNFLNKLHDAGLGSLAAEAGLTKDLSLPKPALNSSGIGKNVKRPKSALPESVKTVKANQTVGDAHKRPEIVKKVESPRKKVLRKPLNNKTGKSKPASEKSRTVTESPTKPKADTTSTPKQPEIEKSKKPVVDARKVSEPASTVKTIESVVSERSTPVQNKESKELVLDSSEDIFSGENIKSFSSLLAQNELNDEQPDQTVNKAPSCSSSSTKNDYASDFEESHSEIAEVNFDKSNVSYTESSEEDKHSGTGSLGSDQDSF